LSETMPAMRSSMHCWLTLVRVPNRGTKLVPKWCPMVPNVA
jgi:hypothetical protein